MRIQIRGQRRGNRDPRGKPCVARLDRGQFPNLGLGGTARACALCACGNVADSNTCGVNDPGWCKPLIRHGRENLTAGGTRI